MTKIGYEFIRSRIVNRMVSPPTNVGMEHLQWWMDGYAQCQNEILDIIEGIELGDDQGR